MAIVTTHKCLALIDIHRNTAFANQTGPIAYILQSCVQNVGELSFVIFPCAFDSEVGGREYVLALEVGCFQFSIMAAVQLPEETQ